MGDSVPTKNKPRFVHLFDDIDSYEDIGVFRLPSEGDHDEEDRENKDLNNLNNKVPFTNMCQLKLVDQKIEPTPTCSFDKSYITPPKVKRQGIKHKIEECTPTISRRRPKQMKPRAIMQPDYFADIADELILQIFQLLPRYNLKQCALTCKRWRRLAYDETLWKRVNLGAKNISTENVELIINRGAVALRLAQADIRSSSDYDDINVDREFISESKLQHLDLSMASVTPAGIFTILCNCKKLKNLSLERCEIDDKLLKLISYNENLEQLNLALSSGITAAGLTRILKKCHRLTAVNLAWTDLDIAVIETAVVSFPSSIRRLNLSGCRGTLNDNHIVDLLLRCPKLEELDLSDCDRLTSLVLITISTRLPNIKSLALSRCFSISPQSYNTIASMKSLKNLDLHGLFTTQGIEFLRWKYPLVGINQIYFSTVGRPTTGNRRTSIWGQKVL
ncbi:F-box protein of unknown function [Chamberlinius hualienensis]